MNDIVNKVALITGAGGGIGREISIALANEKVKLILFGGNNVDKLRETENLVKDKTDVISIPGNLTDLSFIKSGEEKVKSVFGGVDFLINNAGKAENTAICDVTEKAFDDIMNINVKAPFFLTQTLLPILEKSSSATVVNVSSIVSHVGYVNQPIYSASKHALLGFSQSLAREYYKKGVRVHVISPGGVFTDMVKLSRPDLTGEGMTRPQDIAEIVVFLLMHRNNAVIDEIITHRASKEPF